jgi:hypothetical protein
MSKSSPSINLYDLIQSAREDGRQSCRRRSGANRRDVRTSASAGKSAEKSTERARPYHRIGCPHRSADLKNTLNNGERKSRHQRLWPSFESETGFRANRRKRRRGDLVRTRDIWHSATRGVNLPEERVRTRTAGSPGRLNELVSGEARTVLSGPYKRKQADKTPRFSGTVPPAGISALEKTNQ